MNKSFITRVVLCLLLIVFMYAAAACSVSEKKANEDLYKEELEEEIDDSIERARLNAFVNEALAYINQAKNANIEAQLEGQEEKSCYTVEEISNGYSNNYSGVVVKTSGDEWKVYLTNGKYSVDGKKPPINVSDVKKSSKISKDKCD